VFFENARELYGLPVPTDQEPATTS